MGAWVNAGHDVARGMGPVGEAFCVLPVTVLFALFPGFYGLRLIAG